MYDSVPISQIWNKMTLIGITGTLIHATINLSDNNSIKIKTCNKY